MKERVNDKWTEYDPPWVEPDGTIPFRYRVESKSQELWHYVDALLPVNRRNVGQRGSR